MRTNRDRRWAASESSRFGFRTPIANGFQDQRVRAVTVRLFRLRSVMACLLSSGRHYPCADTIYLSVLEYAELHRSGDLGGLGLAPFRQANRPVFLPQMLRWSCNSHLETYNSKESVLKKEIPEEISIEEWQRGRSLWLLGSGRDVNFE
jgi:hypothetical protein